MITELGVKNQMIILKDPEKACKRIQHSFLTIFFKKQDPVRSMRSVRAGIRDEIYLAWLLAL